MKQSEKPVGRVALLIIDMMNPLSFGKGPLLLEGMKKIAQPLAELRLRVKEAGLAVIYVNDNEGRWQSEKEYIVQRALDGPAGGIIRPILPGNGDYFVIKPKHSGFFATPLQALLTELGIRTLILTGVAGNICVLFTANDAYMRDYKLFVPADCCASNVKEDNDFALRMMKNVLKADVREQAAIEFLLPADIRQTK
ncbi:cysteine hydrolase family protein [Sporolactobacillus shoreae]|nr:isochorismatase family cysteine hydrolase [Sporolactobacillus shoreae]